MVTLWVNLLPACGRDAMSLERGTLTVDDHRRVVIDPQEVDRPGDDRLVAISLPEARLRRRVRSRENGNDPKPCSWHQR